ncbi:MAG: exported protein of unknown function [Candidatus Saccharibacteria bacterium]|nr:exported protein of unknown function [Candidatus Saccharibacteria bacterium]
MAKKTKQTRRHHLPFTALIIVVALLGIGLLGLLGYNTYVHHTVEARKTHIQAIYENLNIGDSYIVQTADIFGDKRVYSYDASRTFSSSVTYVRGATVTDTVADLKTKIAAAGFTLFEEPYNGGQQHFKSAKNEYVRVSVSSKSRDDAFQNAILMKESTDDAANMDRNAGPVNVTIKVNLDDNNE